MTFRLIAEQRLFPEGPADLPARIPDRHDTAHRIRRNGILDIGQDAFIPCGNGGTDLPRLVRRGAEAFRPAEGCVLCGDPLPERPAAGPERRVVIRRLILGADGGVFHAPAAGDKDQIVLGQIDPLLLTVRQQADGLCLLSAVVLLKLYVCDPGIIMEADPMVFEVPHHGQDQGFVRIILCEADPRSIPA